ncbi:MAG: AbrB/MazE/SpoVT family DNA-binding domain-containing protein [Methylococcales bacterium]
METVTVSSDFHIEIPCAVRESLGIQPGQKIQFYYTTTELNLFRSNR